MFNLKKYREQKKITQNKLAEMFNVTQKTVSAWESGRNEPNFETLLKLANLFDCSIDELLGREDFEQEKKQPEQVEQIEQPILSDDEIELLAIAKDLTEKEINRLIGFAKSMRDKELSTEEKINKLFKTKD